MATCSFMSSWWAPSFQPPPRGSMWDSSRRILLGCGELWEPLLRISRLELSKWFASPWQFHPTHVVFLGGIAFKKTPQVSKIFNPIFWVQMYIPFGAMPIFRGNRWALGSHTWTTGHLSIYRDRQRGFSETTCLTATEATALRGARPPCGWRWRGVWDPSKMDLHGGSYFLVNMEDGFCWFFWCKKIRVEILSLKMRLWCWILRHALELSPKHYQKEESLVMVLVFEPFILSALKNLEEDSILKGADH